VALVVITSDRGLAGPYNTLVLRATEQVLAEHRSQGHERLLVVVGRRGQSYLRFRGVDVANAVVGITDRPTYLDARRVADLVIGPFVDGDIDQIELVSTRFVSAGIQRVEHRVVVPVPGDLGEDGEGEARPDYDAEPSEEEILDRLLPSLIEAQLFLALLEASASEHAARQRAMKAATDNADDLITNLVRVMNRARQDTITSEIIDIVGGAEALRGEGAGHEPQPSEPRSAAP
jgi:F-type H+-transporting ATPase subunit gamma